MKKLLNYSYDTETSYTADDFIPSRIRERDQDAGPPLRENSSTGDIPAMDTLPFINIATTFMDIPQTQKGYMEDLKNILSTYNKELQLNDEVDISCY